MKPPFPESPTADTHPFDQPYRRPLHGTVYLLLALTIAFCALTNWSSHWITDILKDVRMELGKDAEFNVQFVLFVISVVGTPFLGLASWFCFFPTKPVPNTLLKIGQS